MNRGVIRSVAQLMFLVSLLLVLFSFGANAAHAQNDCMYDYPTGPFSPQWVQQFEQWCTRHGGTPEIDQSTATGQCDPGPDWCGANASGQSAGTGDNSTGAEIGGVLTQALMQDMNGNTAAATSALDAGSFQIGASILGGLLGSLLSGSNQSNQASNRAAVEQERELEQERALEATREKKFQADLRNLEQSMLGPKLPDENVLFKDTSTPFFGENSSTGRELQFKPITNVAVQQRFTNPTDQARISECLSRMAAQAKSADDAQYLTEEAAKAMDGSVVDVDVSSCKPGGVAAAPPTPPSAPVELTPAVRTLYTSLVHSTTQQMDKLQKLQEKKVDLITKKVELDKKIAAMQSQLSKLQTATLSPLADTAAPQAKLSPISEVKAALHTAQQEEIDNQKEQTDVNSQMKNVDEVIKRNQQCFEEAQTDPTKAASLSKQCSS